MSLYIVMSYSVDAIGVLAIKVRRLRGTPEKLGEAGSRVLSLASRVIVSWLQSSTNQCRHPQATSNSSRQRPISTTQSLQQINCRNILEFKRRNSKRNVVVRRAAKQVSLGLHCRIVRMRSVRCFEEDVVPDLVRSIASPLR